MRFAVRFPCYTLVLLFLVISQPALAAVRTVTNTNDSGPGSLREALSAAASGDRIEFSIGSGPQTIKPQTALPTVVGAIVIDGRTQPGYTGKPIIEIDGSFVFPSWINGFDLRDAEVYGLVINNFSIGMTLGKGAVYNCYFGLDVSGTIAKPNYSYGLFVTGDPTTTTVIGGPGANGNYFVSSNTKLAVGTNVSVQGNVFGTNVTQTATLGPSGPACDVWGDNVTVGGQVPNVFVNSQFGVLDTFRTNLRVEGNYIGTTPGGVTGYMERGVMLHATSDTLVQGNIIKGPTLGVVVAGGSTHLRNKVLGNSIQATFMGIEVENARPFPYGDPTPNDPGDVDIGPNNFINYPVIASSTTSNGQTTITGTLATLPNTTQRVELFASSACAGSGYGPGETFIDSFDLTTDGSGAASFTRMVSALSNGTVITATATSDSEGTSEFSPCIANVVPGTFSFQGTAAAVAEGAATLVTVNRVDGTFGEVTVSFAVTGGTASATDFTGANGTLTFAAGETSKSFSVQSTNDSTYEADETIRISLTGATAGAAIGSPSTTTLTIDDDDPPPAVSLQSIEIHEGDSGTTIAEVPVVLSEPAGVAYAVAYTISAGDGATAGVDFVAASGSVTLAPGETEKHIPVTIFGEKLYESTEFVNVTLTANPSVHASVAILNDDPPPTVFIRDLRFVESAEGGMLFATLESDVPVLGDVNIVFHEGSAHAVTDFASIPATFSFNWETSKTFPIVILDDDVPEGDEQFTIDIQTTSAGITAGPTAVVTIVNDDLRVTPAEQWIPSGGTGTFRVELGASPEDVTLALTPNTPGVSVSSTLVVPAGQSSAEFTVSALAPGVDAEVTVAMPVNRRGATRVVLARTYAKTTLRFSPPRLTIIEGENFEGSVSLDPPSPTATTIRMTSTSRVDVPSSVTIPAGASATFVIAARMKGAFTIEAQLPPANGNEVQSLFGDVIVPASSMRVSSVSPSSGTTAGGTHVRIDGAHFNGTCWLFFGRAAATNVIVRNSESITGVTPLNAIGATDVTVRCTGGAFTAEDAYAYRDDDDPAPLITAIDPPSAAPGELVTIHGLNFRPTDAVAFDASSAEIVDATPESHVVAVPDLPPGDVRISVAGMSGPLFSVLEAHPGRITAVTPASVAPGGELELTGEGFRASTMFEIGGHPATILSIGPSRAIVRVSFDVSPGTYPAQLHNHAEPAVDGPPVEIVEGGTIVISANPRCAMTSGGVYAILRGRGFTAGATVSFAGVPSSDVELVNGATLRVKVPPGNAGAARISVTDGTGRTATLTNGFSYASPFDPRGCGGRTRTVRH
ncbi:MAG TPA: Calx-beta domain-containing protein [Thermoanaerobaculia bacterium]|nr:Calx-beta domain-containing protein [Thermoanaerobaculia bacterium]